MRFDTVRFVGLVVGLVGIAGSASAGPLFLPTEATPFIGALTVAGVGRLGMALMIVRRRKSAVMRRLMAG